MNIRKKYLQDSIVGGAAKAIGIISGYGSLWLLTTILSETNYGAYVTGFAVIGLLSLIAQFGLRQATTQKVAELTVKQDLSATRYAGAAITWVGIAGTILAVTIWIVTPFFKGIIQTDLIFWIQFFGALLPGMALRSICSGILRGFEMVSEAIVVTQVVTHIIRLVGLALCFTFWPSPTAVVLAIAASIYVPIIIITALSGGWKYINITGIPLSHVRFSAYLFINSLASQFLRRTDILLLSGLATLAGAGGYNVAWKIALVSQYGDKILTNVLQPRLSKFLEKDEIQDLIREFDMVRDLSIAAGLPPLIVAIIFGKDLLILFGDYADQYNVLLVLTVGVLINASFGSIGQILLMGKRGRLILLNTIISMGGNIILNITLIPRYGTLGAAIATVITVFFITNLIAAIQVKYYMDIDTFDSVALVGVGAIVIALSSYIINIANSIIFITVSLGVLSLLTLRRTDEIKWLAQIAEQRIL